MEKIEGKSKVDLLHRLKDEKTLINVHLSGTEFERITLILDIVSKGKIDYLVLDYMKGFREARIGINPMQLKFEFTGPDKLQYSFKSVGGEISRNGIWVPFPDTVVRKQRRRHFRLDAPPNSEMTFKSNAVLYRLKLMDVSLGGALVLLPRRKPSKRRPSVLNANRSIFNIELLFPREKQMDVVKVLEAVILRVDIMPDGERERAAIRFTSIARSEEQILNEIIYRFQRFYLRKRKMT